MQPKKGRDDRLPLVIEAGRIVEAGKPDTCMPRAQRLHLLAHQLSMLAAETKFIEPLPSSPRDDDSRYFATGSSRVVSSKNCSPRTRGHSGRT